MRDAREMISKNEELVYAATIKIIEDCVEAATIHRYSNCTSGCYLLLFEKDDSKQKLFLDLLKNEFQQKERIRGFLAEHHWRLTGDGLKLESI